MKRLVLLVAALSLVCVLMPRSFISRAEAEANAILDEAVGAQIAQMDRAVDNTPFGRFRDRVQRVARDVDNFPDKLRAQAGDYIDSQLDPETADPPDPHADDICRALHRIAKKTGVPVDGICTGLGQ